MGRWNRRHAVLAGGLFFTEAIFFGIYMYGWHRISPGAISRQDCLLPSRHGLGRLRCEAELVDEQPNHRHRGARQMSCKADASCVESGLFRQEGDYWAV